MTLAPTLDIRPGYAFKVIVTKDVVFLGPYPGAHPRMNLKRSRSRAGETVGGVPGDLHETLAGCTRYSREEHGAAINRWPLVIQMLRLRGRRPPLPDVATSREWCIDRGPIRTGGRDTGRVAEWVGYGRGNSYRKIKLF